MLAFWNPKCIQKSSKMRQACIENMIVFVINVHCAFSLFTDCFIEVGCGACVFHSISRWGVQQLIVCWVTQVLGALSGSTPEWWADWLAWWLAGGLWLSGWLAGWPSAGPPPKRLETKKRGNLKRNTFSLLFICFSHFQHLKSIENKWF